MTMFRGPAWEALRRHELAMGALKPLIDTERLLGSIREAEHAHSLVVDREGYQTMLSGLRDVSLQATLIGERMSLMNRDASLALAAQGLQDLERQVKRLMPSAHLLESLSSTLLAAKRLELPPVVSTVGPSEALRKMALQTAALEAGIQQWMERSHLQRRPRAFVGLQRYTRRAGALWDDLSADPEGLSAMSQALTELPVRGAFELTRAVGISLTGEDEYVDAEAPAGLITVEAMQIPDVLHELDPAFRLMYLGIHDAYRSTRYDVARQALVSARELIDHLLRRLAPEPSVVGWRNLESDRNRGALKREARISFIFRHLAVGDSYSKMVAAQVKVFASHYLTMCAVIHTPDPKLEREQLRSLIRMADYILIELLSASKPWSRS